eukprot:CAMPEP_0172630428 /NCGR_PEP_ID=MMETSP1068-20121228/173691_1 /TAXON_ID=35684 /ORGANISM="Pseudopedinella elastica, Strain CCMP716" /LENGTH=60 /DNA_ID=CAMNT_0013441273 /DNA_START=152 /DNA_END=334 /DNA_ORIENTATION=-
MSLKVLERFEEVKYRAVLVKSGCELNFGEDCDQVALQVRVCEHDRRASFLLEAERVPELP